METRDKVKIGVGLGLLALGIGVHFIDAGVGKLLMLTGASLLIFSAIDLMMD